MACERTARRVMLALTFSDCSTNIYCGRVPFSETKFDCLLDSGKVPADMTIGAQIRTYDSLGIWMIRSRRPQDVLRYLQTSVIL